jgi:hypothetical protein
VTGSPGGSAGPDDSIYPIITSSDLAGGRNLNLRPRSADATSSVSLTLIPPQANGAGGGVTIAQDKTLDGAQQNNLRISGQWTGDYSGVGGSQLYYNSYLLVSADIRSATTSEDKPVTGIGVGCRPDSNGHFIGLRSRGLESGQAAASRWVGVQSEIETSHATEAYNIYAIGTAPNYFKGEVECNKSLYCNSVPENFLSTNSGFRVAAQNTTNTASGLEVISRSSSNNSTKTALLFTKEDTNGVEATAVAGYLRINDGLGSASSITLTSSDGASPVVAVVSDYRTKTLTPFTGAASAIVQQLQPGANGFIAHDLQAVIPEAVTGQKDETETVGTYTDTDGTIEYGVEEPDAIPYGATWEATETRQVLQAVDTSRLVPLLTKALQEVMQKNEDLEARIAALEGA